MIAHEEQLALFDLISKNLDKNITCWAFGGTAMMFYGYKDDTKDIDLLFENKNDRDIFIKTLEKIGFKKSSPFKVYIKKKAEDSNKPIMYSNDDTRFDLFSKKIFRTKLSPNMKEDFYAIHDFIKGKKFRIIVLKKEHLVQLKAITERDKDFEDIVTIIKKENNFDWEYFTDEVIWQYKNGDNWAILDIHSMLEQLKEYHFIDGKWLKKLEKNQS